jgi:hypothetical protein
MKNESATRHGVAAARHACLAVGHAKNSALALCTRSATLLACQDGKGSYYSVRTEGSTFYLRGYDFDSRRLWAQTNSRYGTLTFLPAWPAMAKPGWVTAAVLAGPP